jgi:hypothetical protein
MAGKWRVTENPFDGDIEGRRRRRASAFQKDRAVDPQRI